MRKLLLLLLVTMFLASCGGAKIASSGKAESMSTKEVLKHHKSTEPEFKTLAARVQVAHETAKKEQRITVSFRMEKDKAIWAKASILGITVAKVYITPDRVSYYETIGGTYFDGDFSLISEWLGVEVDFRQTQDILLGQAVFDMKSGNYTTEVSQNKFKIQPKNQLPNFIHSLFINPGNFRVASTSIEQPDEGRTLYLRYGDYQKLGDQYFPLNISVVSTEKGEQTKISLDYRKIDVDADVSFPFEIPSGYDRIEF